MPLAASGLLRGRQHLRFLIPIASLTGRFSFTGRGRLMPVALQSVYEALYRERGCGLSRALPGPDRGRGTDPRRMPPCGQCSSSQFISGLLFALPLLSGNGTLHLIPPVESHQLHRYDPLCAGGLR